MADYEHDQDYESEEERAKRTLRQVREDRQLTRDLRRSMLQQIRTGEPDPANPGLTTDSKTVYKVETIMRNMDQQAAEAEKGVLDKQSNDINQNALTEYHKQFTDKIGDPSALLATGQRGTRDVSPGRRLLPDRKATSEHTKRGDDPIDFDATYNVDTETEE